MPGSCLFEAGTPVSLWLLSSSWYFVGLLWLGLFCLLVKEFYGTRYQSDFLFLNQCGFSLVVQEKKRKEKTPLVVMTQPAWLREGVTYLGFRTRQPPTAQTGNKKLMWVRGVVCCSTRTQSLTVCLCCIAVHTLFLWVQMHVWWSVHSFYVSIFQSYGNPD